MVTKKHLQQWQRYITVRKEPTLSRHVPKKNDKSYPIDYLNMMFLMNRALWGEVSLALRAVSIKWDQEEIHLFFYYDGEISENDHESAECVGTEIISDFPEHHLEMDIIQLDYPKPIPYEGVLVYLRREKKCCVSIHCHNKIPEANTRIHIIITTILALQGEIPPSLRAVRISWTDTEIHLYFYYDKEINEDDSRSYKSVIDKMTSHFPSYKLKSDIIRCDYPKQIPQEVGETIYWRRENNNE